MNVNDDLIETTGPGTLERDLRDRIFSYSRHWKWFLFSIFISLALGYVYLRLATPKYKIETDLLIKPDDKSQAGQNDLLKDLDLFSSDKIIDNEVQVLKSKDIIEKIIRGLNLQTSYYSTNGVRKH